MASGAVGTDALKGSVADPRTGVRERQVALVYCVTSLRLVLCRLEPGKMLLLHFQGRWVVCFLRSSKGTSLSPRRGQPPPVSDFQLTQGPNPNLKLKNVTRRKDENVNAIQA